MGFLNKILSNLGIKKGIESSNKNDNEDSEQEYFCPNCETNLELQKGFSPDRKYWKCLKCGQELYGDEIYEGERFPGIMWHCDECGALLNIQKNFTDLKDEWKCQGCGHINPLDNENINESDEEDSEELELLGECVNCGEPTYENDDYCEDCWNKLFPFNEFDISNIINDIDNIRNEIMNKLTELNTIRDELPNSTGCFYTNSFTNILDDLEKYKETLEIVNQQVFNTNEENKTKSNYKSLIKIIKSLIGDTKNFYFNKNDFYEIIKCLEASIHSENYNREYKAQNKILENGYLCKKCLCYTKALPKDYICIECKKEYLMEINKILGDMEKITNKVPDLFLGIDI